MKNRWIATLLLLAMALALVPTMAAAEPVVLSLTLGAKETYAINTSAITGAEGKQLVFATSNKKVATVSSDGVITANRRGTAKIAVGYDDTALAVCTVTVMAAPKKITMDETAVVLNAGETRQLAVTLSKKSASAAIAYESSDAAVATVDNAGKVTAVAKGAAVITARTFNGKEAKCGVLVLGGKAPEKLAVNVQSVSLLAKETFQLTPSVEEGADAAYFYATANKKIATVSADGVVTAKKKGATEITVKTHNGLTATVAVIVKGKLKDLYGCLTDKPKTFLKYAKKLKMKRDTTTDENTVMYYSDQAALIMTAKSCQVSLTPSTSPKYSLQGADPTMTAEQAAEKLTANGWALADTKTQDGIEIRAFTKNGDTTRVIAISVDGSDIKSLDAYWTWKTE